MALSFTTHTEHTHRAEQLKTKTNNKKKTEKDSSKKGHHCGCQSPYAFDPRASRLNLPSRPENPTFESVPSFWAHFVTDRDAYTGPES